jgi:N,N'-diacetyllegionaminate synthase
MRKIYNILEVANTHGGSINYILDLLDEFEEFNKKNGFGIKFQPFKYDQIATEDFEWYKVYQELYIDEIEWAKIFNKAYDTKDIWIDVFDLYGVSIIQKNLDNIHGLKLQTSILDNQEVYNALQATDISKLKLIINVAGRDKVDIKDIVNKYEALNAEELLLEVGFQAYPTDLADSGLSKIKYLKDSYKYRVVFADHVDGECQEATTLPLIASLLGANCIEKHIMHSTLETKYDGFSSVKYKTYKKIIENQNKFLPLMDSVFVNDSETKYLNDSYQIPILKAQKSKSSIVNLDTDFIFRRSGLDGLNSKQIKGLTSSFHILKTSQEANKILKKEDFRKANISAIIACRLKSSRLPKKAILKIGGITSIELCIKNTLKISNLNNVILATSDNKQDSELSKYTYDDSVIFHQGDAEDVIARYLDIINELKIDVFVRITGDMPYVSSDISNYLLRKHFECGADYTVAKNFSVGTSVEIINTTALKKVKKYFPNADYSEYMTWYFQNNPEYFNLNFVDLPQEWVRDYRLTLDYQEDLEMFSQIEGYFKASNLDYSIQELYKFLDENPKISELNSHISLVYKTDKELIKLLNKKTKI